MQLKCFRDKVIFIAQNLTTIIAMFHASYFFIFYVFQNPFIDKEQAEALEKLTDSKPGQVQKWSVSISHKSKQIMPVIRRCLVWTEWHFDDLLTSFQDVEDEVIRKSTNLNYLNDPWILLTFVTWSRTYHFYPLCDLLTLFQDVENAMRTPWDEKGQGQEALQSPQEVPREIWGQRLAHL